MIKIKTVGSLEKRQYSVNFSVRQWPVARTLEIGVNDSLFQGAPKWAPVSLEKKCYISIHTRLCH